MKRWLIMPLLMGIACSVSGANMESNAISSINQVKQITKDIYLLPGQLQSNQSPDGNSEILRGPKGLIVIDTGRNDQHTQQLIDAIIAMKLPVAGVINTHWHLDHIGGNARFKQQWPGISIYAHPSLDNALVGFHKDYRQQLETYVPTLENGSPEKQRYEAEITLLKLDRALAATNPVTQSTIKQLGGRKIEINVSEHSVTEGDIWVFDPTTATLIAGDLVTLPVPMFDSACPEGWQHALDTLAAAKFKRLIPGHGAPMSPEEFEQYHRGFNNLLACAKQSEKQQCIDHWFDDVRLLNGNIDEGYGRALLSYYFDQFIKPDAPKRKFWCKA
jgi:glyoxylase-like metal-dependent hydrolase (beta-lactamase superfamily II)